jgi:2-oxoglutarate dehydrogenase E1 component
VLTPKSLLRHPAVASAPIELETGRFRSVIDDDEARTREEHPPPVCSAAARCTSISWAAEQRKTSQDVAICRVEQLAPFPSVALREVLDVYPSVRDVVWLQEEPENMGAWDSCALSSRNCWATAVRCATSGARAAPARQKARPRGISSISGALVERAFESRQPRHRIAQSPFQARPESYWIERVTSYVQYRRP